MSIMDRAETARKHIDELEQEIEQLRKESKVCTGCGHDNSPVEPPALGCCPDSRYRTAAELLKELDEAKHPTKLEEWCKTVEHKNLELSAYVERLRDALIQFKDGCDSGSDEDEMFYHEYENAIDALIATPTQSLQVHDNKVIEECAEAVGSWSPYSGAWCYGRDVAKTIRNLKGDK